VQSPRSRSFGRHRIIGVHQLATLKRKASAPDTSPEIIPYAFHVFDVCREHFMPAFCNLRPVALFRRSPQWEFVKCFLDVRERDPDPLGGTNESDSSKHITVEASLVPFISRTEDEAFTLIEMKCRHCDTASICHLSD